MRPFGNGTKPACFTHMKSEAPHKQHHSFRSYGSPNTARAARLLTLVLLAALTRGLSLAYVCLFSHAPERSKLMSAEEEVRRASEQFYTALNRMANGDAGSMTMTDSHVSPALFRRSVAVRAALSRSSAWSLPSWRSVPTKARRCVGLIAHPQGRYLPK